MLSTILVWFIWLFLFIPVLAWIFGLILPIDRTTPTTPETDGTTTTSPETQVGSIAP